MKPGLADTREMVEETLEGLGSHTGEAIARTSENQTLYEVNVEWVYRAHRSQTQN